MAIEPGAVSRVARQPGKTAIEANQRVRGTESSVSPPTQTSEHQPRVIAIDTRETTWGSGGGLMF
ncbi:MAG TPA: hypothetical protein VL985_18130 [Stellaceae bacterium]|nr:hypothetical protein [Stellaceae bacterium]